jgi:hypothetical protein
MIDGSSTTGKQISIPDAWHLRAEPLADWTLARLVNRRDACGAYFNGGQVTRRITVDRARLIRHYQGRYASHIIGVYPADANNLAKWGALDLDVHGDDPRRAEANRHAAQHWHGELVRRGFRPLLTASNGRGGFHLRVLLVEPIDAGRLFHFMRSLTADHRHAGLDKRPECFPKQPDMRRCAKQLGNWLRLPGKHYKYDFWSEMWDGSRWLAGEAAIDFMLSLDGDDPALVPIVPAPAPKPITRPRHYADGNNLSARIAAYLRRLPNLAEGQGRDDVAFRFAAWLARDLALDDVTALAWLERWDSGNNPPKGREVLSIILKNARAYGQRPIGAGVAMPPNRTVAILPSKRPGHHVLHLTVEIP